MFGYFDYRYAVKRVGDALSISHYQLFKIIKHGLLEY